tara:strand:+ start:7870 stop:8325 length:456 start_codon:yes stop_codon:yes gene_type:complete
VGVVVFADARKDTALLPAGAKQVRAKGGNTIPMVFVTTADGGKGIDAISYATLKSDMSKSVRTLRKTLANAEVVGEGPVAKRPATVNSESNPQLSEIPDFRHWTTTAGKSFEAAATKIENGRVLFLLPNGKTLWGEISKLSAKSQKNLPSH